MCKDVAQLVEHRVWNMADPGLTPWESWEVTARSKDGIPKEFFGTTSRSKDSAPKVRQTIGF